MTQALEAAIASAAKLPPQEQDALAALLVAEMESEERWGDLFSHSQGLLAELAQQALLEHAAGQTQPRRSWSEVGHDRTIPTALRESTQRASTEDPPGL
jgi:hypothetical protein